VLIIFISAIVISTFLHIYALKAFSCEISTDAKLVEKAQLIKLTVRVGKAAFFLPSAFGIKFNLSYHLQCSEDSYTVTLSRREKEQTFLLKANFWGKATLGIDSISGVDILGIFAPLSKYFLKSKAKQSLFVKVFPSIPDLSKTCELIRTLQDACAYDDNEQSREVPFAIIGFPGYEHRDYVPGDSLKSINWKLSAKRDRLLTRKPEAYAGGDQVLILDGQKSNRHNTIENDLTARTHEQTALESMLALAQILTKQEILCRAYVRFEEKWEVFHLHNTGDIEKLRFAFTEYSYTDSADRLPDIAGEKANGFLIFTSCPDSGLYAKTESLRQKGITPQIASPAAGYANNWLIQEIDGEIIFKRD
jgi:hypothetical protein